MERAGFLTVLARTTPADAYRRVDFDARVSGASGAELVGLCYEQLAQALDSALFAHEHADNRRKSECLTRALSAVLALQMGVCGEDAVADALRQFYEGARRTVLDSVLAFDPAAIATLRVDVADIARALSAA